MGYKTEKKIPSIILSVFIVLLILVGTIVPAYAAPTQDMMVTDSGEMLSDREEQEVSEMLYSINRQTGIEYLVYTIKSLNSEDMLIRSVKHTEKAKSFWTAYSDRYITALTPLPHYL